jgi:hypothetical protein
VWSTPVRRMLFKMEGGAELGQAVYVVIPGPILHFDHFVYVVIPFFPVVDEHSISSFVRIYVWNFLFAVKIDNDSVQSMLGSFSQL